jgi:hypothetical protein
MSRLRSPAVALAEPLAWILAAKPVEFDDELQ